MGDTEGTGFPDPISIGSCFTDQCRGFTESPTRAGILLRPSGTAVFPKRKRIQLSVLAPVYSIMKPFVGLLADRIGSDRIVSAGFWQLEVPIRIRPSDIRASADPADCRHGELGRYISPPSLTAKRL